MSLNHTQATVITGPKGLVMFLFHILEQLLLGRRFPTNPSSGSVPSQHTSSGGSVPSQQEPTSGSVPSQQVTSTRSVPPQQTSPIEIGSEAEDSTLHPLLPFPMEPGLREILDRLAKPFTLPEEPHSSAPSMENILEDPRIQSVLNGLFNGLPTICSQPNLFLVRVFFVQPLFNWPFCWKCPFSLRSSQQYSFVESFKSLLFG
ncbi:hypothetical protein RCL1_004860 [Eukaryota sp. TZLM3-RCL]